MPRFAPICHYRYIFNNLHGNFKPRKSCQNTANRGILGGKFIMIKILFVCHGNICRSTMSESVMTHLVKQRHLEHHFQIASAATSREEIGNGPHYGTVNKLRAVGIPVIPHRAVQMTKADYHKYDYLIGMDDANIRNMTRIAGGDPECKIHKLLEYAGSSRAIADPWYTGDFDTTYDDILEGCEALLACLDPE
jgi:protein-tyrosine phosphatase